MHVTLNTVCHMIPKYQALISAITLEAWDPKACSYKVSSILNVLVTYVRNHHKLSD